MQTRPFSYCQTCGALTPVRCYYCNDAFCFDHLHKTLLENSPSIIGCCVSCLHEYHPLSRKAPVNPIWQEEEYRWWQQATMDS